MTRKSLLAIILLSAVGLAACSGSKSPAEPSDSAGVNVNGSIVAPGGSAGAASSSKLSASIPATAPAGLLVSVAGTNISAAVDAVGKFSLKNVPPGNAELRFTWPGASSSLGLTDLQGGQEVTIAVSLSGSTVTLESDHRSLGSEVQLEGRVEDLPAAPANSLIVAGQAVTTNSSTTYWLQGSPAAFADLAIGQRVHVKGQAAGTGATASLLAREVKIQNTNTGVGLNFNGLVSNFSGDATAFQFEVNGQLIKGDSATEFFGNSEFAYLMNGAEVEVKASPRTGFVYAARIHVETEEIEFSGVIGSKTGTAPDLTLGIAPHTVETTSSTEVKRGGDTQGVDVLYVGLTVDVSGRLLADGTVIAKKISIVLDAPGGTFEMEGTLSGKSGTCPTISFSVSGYAIATNLSTTFTGGTCASFSNGTKVLVKGTVQANLSVLASSVAKQ